MELPKDFYKLVEEINYLKNVLYSDTDSIYIRVPTNVKDLAVENKIKIANKVGKEINEKIQEYLLNTYFKRANIDKDHNMTDFKTELIMDSIMFIPNVKKQYAYNMIVKNHKILDKPDTEYKGIQVVRVDATKLGQEFLREMIENIILNSQIHNKDKMKAITNLINEIRDKFIKCCNDFEIEDIGISSKWSKNDKTIISMKLYNYIMEQNTFLPGSSGRFVYCSFGKPRLFEPLNIDMKKIDSISIPYNYSPNILKEKFEKFDIKIDQDKQWKRVFTTTCLKIVELVEKETNKQ